MDCKSANNPDGKTDAILLKPFWDSKKEFISIDACIVETIKVLWKFKIVTCSCCCGHGRRNPSVVIDEASDAEQAREIFKIFCSREWDVYQWQLNLVTGKMR
ncbi:MAG TPA: hypothetical protein ENI08_03410 [Candidatus Dependentiae bacterium]|nr:hypothetical protein [Candidatus Dependentiae bacterium]